MLYALVAVTNTPQANALDVEGQVQRAGGHLNVKRELVNEQVRRCVTSWLRNIDV